MFYLIFCHLLYLPSSPSLTYSWLDIFRFGSSEEIIYEYNSFKKHTVMKKSQTLKVGPTVQTSMTKLKLFSLKSNQVTDQTNLVLLSQGLYQPVFLDW